MASSGKLTSSALRALQDGKLAGSWVLDASRSEVRLKGTSVWRLLPVRGVFRQVTGNGTVSAADDVTGTITVAARPVHTKNKRRDEHLPGPQRGPPDPGLPAGRTLAPLDEKVDHVRGSPAGRLIIEYAITSARTRGRPSIRSSRSNSGSAGTCGSRSGIFP